jgi:hypothetical protein
MAKWFETTIMIIILFGSFGGIIKGLLLYGAGYHNIDLSVNGMILESKYDLKLTDQGNFNQNFTMKEAYIEGLNQMDKSIIIILISSLIFGAVIAEIISQYKPE